MEKWLEDVEFYEGQVLVKVGFWTCATKKTSHLLLLSLSQMTPFDLK